MKKLVAIMALTTTLAGSLLAQSVVLTARESEIKAAAENPFVRDNLATFKTFTLSNGIPVIVKINAANRVYNLRLVLRGGSAMTSASQAGIEDVMLQTMARGSQKFPYEKLMQVLDATSSGMGAEAMFDASSYSLNTLDKYFERVFPVWVDTIIAPAFSEADFNQIRENFLQTLESHEQDPWTKLAREVNKRFFGDHPYAVPFDGTKESISGLTLDMVKSRYQSHFSANRMMIIAVGNFNLDSLKAELESSLGQLPNKNVAIPPTTAIKGGSAAPGGLLKVDYPAAQGIAYMRGDFPAPPPSDPDYMAAQIGFKMYTDLLFEVVRTRHSAVYSPGAYIRGNQANYGSITLFKTKEPGTIKNYVDEALAPILRGQCLSSASAGGGSHIGAQAEEGQELKLEDMAAALPIYQAQFINDLYESQQTNAGIAAAIQSSALNFGDYRYYLLSMQLVNAVKAPAIKQIMTKLLTGQKITWGVLAGADLLSTVDAAKF